MEVFCAFEIFFVAFILLTVVLMTACSPKPIQTNKTPEGASETSYRLSLLKGQGSILNTCTKMFLLCQAYSLLRYGDFQFAIQEQRLRRNLLLQSSGCRLVCYTVYYTCFSVARLLKLDAISAPPRAGFDIRSVRVGFVVDRAALGHVFLQILWFCPVRIIPSVLHIYSQETIYYLSS